MSELTPTNVGPGVEPGDIVQVEGGRFSGCVLTYVRPEPKLSGKGVRHICINDSYGGTCDFDLPDNQIRVPEVRLMRKGRPEWAS